MPSKLSPNTPSLLKRPAQPKHTECRLSLSHFLSLLIPSQTTSLNIRILLFLTSPLPTKSGRIRIPSSKSHLDIITLRQVRMASQVGCQITTKDGLTRCFGLALAYFLIPRTVHELIFGKEEISFVFVGLYDDDVK